MTDRPIIFSGPMVRALLDGRKTQTRRVLKPQGTRVWIEQPGNVPIFVTDVRHTYGPTTAIKTPHAGDRLWVREAWRPSYSADVWREDLGRVATPKDFDPLTTAIEYLADNEWELNGKRRPSIHMPRWASRLTLLVEGVKIERLQEINRGGAMEEGCPFSNMARGPNPLDWFREVWSSIHGPASWGANPWVAAITFHVVKENIDRIGTDGA